MTSGGQLTTAFTGFVHRALVAPGRRVNLRLTSWFDADDWHRVVQDAIVLFFKYPTVANIIHRNTHTYIHGGRKIAMRHTKLPVFGWTTDVSLSLDHEFGTVDLLCDSLTWTLDSQTTIKDIFA